MLDANTGIQLKARFLLDLHLIMPIVDEIERTIIAAVPQGCTMMINDMAYFDGPEKLKRILTINKVIE